MARERFQRVVVLLPAGAYRELEALAAREDRVPAQQASYLLKRMLNGVPEHANPEHDEERK